MKIWNAAPLVRLLIPFIVGIHTAVWLPSVSNVLIVLLFVLFIVIVLFTFTQVWSSSYRSSWWYGLFTNILFFLVAYQLTIFKTDKFSSVHFSQFAGTSTHVYARVMESSVEKEKSIKTIVEVIQIQQNSKIKPVFGKAIVYFQKDARSLKLNYGDELILKTTFKKIATVKNPYEFDYRRYLFYKNIYNQAYLKTTDWVYSGKNSGNLLVNYSIRIRNKLLSIFNDGNLKGDEFGVAAALLIGYSDKLDEDIFSAYSQTGALHILSVSGMHVAIVFTVFNWVLFFLDRLKYGGLLKAILLIFFLWLYALLTGLSPSVLRAATMFSFIVCGKSFKRNSNSYNILAASALFLLLQNPYLIMDVGFQLSYLAVIGIVYMQPLLSNLIKTDHWLLNQLVSLMGVSIAAQLTTLPICLYYFHQFPTWFLLTNLIVIPLSTCIIYVGMLLIAVAGNELILKYVSMLFIKMVKLLNASVVFISKLPFAVVENISIDIPEMFLMYGVIIFVFLYFNKKKYYYFKMSLYTLISIFGLQVQKQTQYGQQRKFIVYAIPKVSALDFVTGREHVLLIDTIVKENERAWIQHVKPNWCKLGLHAPVIVSSRSQTACVLIRDEAIQFFDKKIIMLSNSTKINKIRQQGKSIAVDYVIVSKDVQVKIKEMMEVYQPKCIVFDSSNSFYRIEKWKKECVQLQQTYYAVSDSGAFVAAL